MDAPLSEFWQRQSGDRASAMSRLYISFGLLMYYLCLSHVDWFEERGPTYERKAVRSRFGYESVID